MKYLGLIISFLALKSVICDQITITKFKFTGFKNVWHDGKQHQVKYFFKLLYSKTENLPAKFLKPVTQLAICCRPTAAGGLRPI
jgi:hypothetical protein